MKNECYPSWRYHRTEAPKLVHSKSEDLALGKDWADSPAAFEKPLGSVPPAPVVDELKDAPAPTEAPVSATPADPAPVPVEKPLEELSAKQLRELAEARGFKLPGNASKAKLLAALQGGVEA